MKQRFFFIVLFFIFVLSVANAQSQDFIYPFDNSRGAVSSDYFTIRMQLNNPEIYNRGNALRAQVEVASLRNSEHRTVVKINAITIERKDALHFTTLRVPALLPGTVYRARVRFFNREATIGDWTGWYYSTTTGVTRDEQTRTSILLRGFHEFHESQLGKVGENGTEYRDGTKYGAREKEAWCSEFYTWVTGPFLKGISKDSTANKIIKYFERKDAYNEPDDLASRGLRGDYIAYNWDNKGMLDHSGMFLAWDRSQNPQVAWTLEGNVGNQVVVRERTIDDMDGFGHISGIDAANYQACEQWCNAHLTCAKCSTALNCGTGYKTIKSWTGTGTNWHACQEKGRSRNNHTECRVWCGTHPECAKCSTAMNCGVGYERIKSWTEDGTNWYACKEKERSRDHHDACSSWCSKHPECDKCSTLLNCGIGYKTIKSWTGKGTNWHACQKK
jgi:hypothetical protein